MQCYPTEHGESVPREFLQAPAVPILPAKEKAYRKVGLQYIVVLSLALAAALALNIFGTIVNSLMMTIGSMALTLTAAISIGEVRHHS